MFSNQNQGSVDFATALEETTFLLQETALKYISLFPKEKIILHNNSLSRKKSLPFVNFISKCLPLYGPKFNNSKKETIQEMLENLSLIPTAKSLGVFLLPYGFITEDLKKYKECLSNRII